jgi:hypothetical protein
MSVHDELAARRFADPAEARPEKALCGRHRTGHSLLRFILILVTAIVMLNSQDRAFNLIRTAFRCGTFGGYFVTHLCHPSRRDSHTPAARRLFIANETKTGRGCHPLIAFRRVSAQGCSADWTAPVRFEGGFALTAINNNLFPRHRFCRANRRSVGGSGGNRLVTGIRNSGYLVLWPLFHSFLSPLS